VNTEPTVASAQSIRHAFFSQTALEKWGAGLFRTPDGREVWATGLYFSEAQGMKGYGYPDKQYVGVVLMPSIREVSGELSERDW
jgi:hypothetical protein